MITNVHTIFRWMDSSLEWNITEYDGLKSVNIPIEEIWTPGIKQILTLSYKDCFFDIRSLLVKIQKLNSNF